MRRRAERCEPGSGSASGGETRRLRRVNGAAIAATKLVVMGRWALFLRIVAPAALAALLGCTGSATPRSDGALIVGVAQLGGARIGRADGSALNSEAFRLARDGSVTIVQSFGGAPVEQRGHADPADIQRLGALLTSRAWSELPDEVASTDGDDEVAVTIESAGKSVRRSPREQEPIFREVLDLLGRIRAASQGG